MKNKLLERDDWEYLGFADEKPKVAGENKDKR